MTDISYEDLVGKVKDMTVVDVRTRDEVVQQGQLPHSHVLPVQELEEALMLSQESFKEKYGFPLLDTSDENLVITCRSGRRVGIANDILKAKGFTKHKELWDR
ncbi:hypothetical protein O3P69_019062 [Scylla paramamosain]|uniref:Rhodanese domain-containing protein n=1 Tax=Scylla paramamosain TaxID=85552 RepID=A0AAW0T834_SCYPA